MVTLIFTFLLKGGLLQPARITHYEMHTFSYYAGVQVQLAAKTSIFSLLCLGLSRS